MPRMMSVIFPMEIIIMPNTTYILTDYTDPRRIFTDGRAWPKEVEPTFHGYSIGKWIDEDGDGRYDVLEVESRGFKGPRTFEASGIELHDDGETIIKERISLDKTDKDVCSTRSPRSTMRSRAPGPLPRSISASAMGSGISTIVPRTIITSGSARTITW